MLDGIEADARFRHHRFRPVGDTDSEIAFCALLERLAQLWSNDRPPSLEDRREVVAAFARDAGALGPANFIYSDGDALFAHGHRRTHADGEIRSPGLHVLCRTCAQEVASPALVGVSMTSIEQQEVVLVASVPLTTEHWRPLREGEIIVMQGGRVLPNPVSSMAGLLGIGVP
jgi:glutamine amidotransferase